MSQPLIIRFPRGTIIYAKQDPKSNETNTNKSEYMETILSNGEVKDLYSKTSESGKELMLSLFGYRKLGIRKIGVWCLSTENDMIAANQWHKEAKSPQGVLIVTGETAFIVAPHNTVVAQFSPNNKGNGYVDLITDKDSLDSSKATGRILRAYDGSVYTDKDGDTEYDFVGAPAAEFCRRYHFGNRGVGAWDLPTVKQLQIIAQNIKEVNACFRAMGFPPMVMGCYWSSIVKDEWCAWYVSMGGGDAGYGTRLSLGCVRAVSAFQY